MTSRTLVVATLCFSTLFGSILAAQERQMPSGMTHAQHLAQMKKDAELKQQGGIAMGFDQDKATHHFALTPNGGTIAVTANDKDDQRTRDQIRSHLQEIARSFSQGDFQKPLVTHGETPDGVQAMARLRLAITYSFEPTDRGGLVRLATSDAMARDAIHEFLRYQMMEHRTGDAVRIRK